MALPAVNGPDGGNYEHRLADSAKTDHSCPPSYEGTAEEHARRIMEVVMADNPIGRRAA